ncbi:DUF6301 family protein [Actinoplanes sp. NPDC020271]|uniref:DUF6301 family protein n=1 Tax=Actinoplanes sp. NPDC020271 TaxID=3363896 RepID=UPI0037B6CEDF
MTDALDAASLVEAANALLAVAPLLGSATAQEMAQALDWPVTRHRPERSISLDPGYGIGPSGAYAGLDTSDRPRALLVDVSNPDHGGPEFRQDVFAAAAATLAEALGPATDRRPGENPALWWRREPTVLRLVNSRDGVYLQLDLIDRLEQEF